MSRNTGIGALVVFSGAVTFTGNWRQITGYGESVEVLDKTGLASTDFKEFVPDDLRDTRPMTIDCYWNFATAPPRAGDKCTLTVTDPLQDNQTTPGTITGSCIISEVNFPDLAPGQLLVGQMVVKFDGLTGPVITQST